MSGPDGAVAGRQLALVGVTQVLAMATWFTAAAVAPSLGAERDLSTAATTLLTTAVQIGFVVGALVSAATALADRLAPQVLMGVGASTAALTTATVALVDLPAPGLVGLRLVCGAALALVYPVGMKLAVSWFRARRGLAVSLLVGALTLGSLLPHFLAGILGDAWRTALLVAAVLAACAALLQRWVRPGPLLPATPAVRLGSTALVALASRRGPRLANLGYLGHMWELYAVWAWFPVLLAASIRAHGDRPSAALVGAVSFLAFGVLGLAGCVVAGLLADRVGPARVAVAAMVTSGGCCLAAALAFGGPTPLLVAVALVWGPAVIADSAMFSTCMGEVAPADYVGTALTLQTAMGFLLTAATIQVAPVVASAASWPTVAVLLAVGPLLGAVAMLRLDLAVLRGPRTT